MRRMLALVGLALALAIGSPALAQTRVALIVANGAYAEEPLTNPRVDAGLVEASLSKAGFAVKVVLDVDLEAFDNALSDFAERAKGADLAVFYFAGHGFAVNAGIQPVNMLMATDAKLTAKSELVLAKGGMPIDAIVERLRDRAKATLLFIDACRNDPRLKATGGAGRGLAPVASFSADSLYIGVSTQLGKTASDGDTGQGSPFARAFAAVAPTPGLRIDDAFRAIRERVERETGGRQVPDVVKDELPSGSIVFVPGAPPPVVAMAPPPLPAPPAPCGGVTTVDVKNRSAAPLTEQEECALRRGDVFQECSDCPAMAVIPKGSFTMGSPDNEPGRNPEEGPRHDVTFARAFAVGEFHVTRDEFAAFVKETGYDAGSSCPSLNGRALRSWRDPGFPQTGRDPVVCVSWNDAHAYVAWLTRKTGAIYRLLTESEWEYAARGRTEPGTYPRYFFGDSEHEFCRYGNGLDQTAKAKKVPGANSSAILPCSDGYAYTSPVGSFQPNAFGLFDMHGDAWQWVEDCFRVNYDNAPADGSAVTSGDCSARGVRGLSWNDGPRILRAAVRNGLDPAGQSIGLGFRVARTLRLTS